MLFINFQIANRLYFFYTNPNGLMSTSYRGKSFKERVFKGWPLTYFLIRF